MCTPRNRYLRSCSLLVIILGFLVGSDYAQAKPLVDQNQISHLGSEYAPAPLTSNPQVDEIPSEEWNSYESVTGGYSFQYPSAYFVAEGEKGFVQLRRSQDGSDQELITLMYLDYEIEETDDLLEWAKLYDIHHKEGMFELAFSPTDLEKAEYPEGSRQIAISSTLASPLAMHAFLITNGRLVLRVSAYSSDQDKQQTLREVAQSVTFSSDAPLTFSQLYAPDPPPYFTTLSEFLSYTQENEQVRAALNMRSTTGETPTDLLGQMSERARSSYERTLAANAALLGELDRQRALPPSTGDEYSESDYQSYLESEREYNKTLLEGVPSLAPKHKGPQSESLSPFFTRQATGVLANCSGVVPTSGLDNRRGLPARFTTPIRTYNPAPAVACGSSYHTNEDTYSADIQVGIGTDVYATTQNETVYDRRITDPGSGYGKYVRTSSLQYVNGTWRQYYNLYAHLDQVNVEVSNVLGPSNTIGKSGNTGNVGPHLHFTIFTDLSGTYDGNFAPVDLSPVKGFTPNLLYPAQCTFDCGTIRDPSNEPLILEANEFQFSSQPVASGHYWNCSTYLPNHTGTCYRAAVPIDPQWGLDPITVNNVHLTPRISYQIWIPVAGLYRIWVCGRGGSTDDDSLHMGNNSIPTTSADRITGYHSGDWIWDSLTMDGVMPTLNLSYGYNNIDVWARENGMRIDRILLTRSLYYVPPWSIMCGAAHLYD